MSHVDEFETDYIIYADDEDRKRVTLIIDSPISMTNADYVRELEYFILVLQELGTQLDICPKESTKILN